jgi:hypothetical protein
MNKIKPNGPRFIFPTSLEENTTSIELLLRRELIHIKIGRFGGQNIII